MENDLCLACNVGDVKVWKQTKLCMLDKTRKKPQACMAWGFLLVGPPRVELGTNGL